MVSVCPACHYRCSATDSLPRGYPGQLFRLQRVLELDSERRDSPFILVRALNHDRVITLRPIDVNLCVGLIVFYRLLLQGVPVASLYIDREGCGAITILVRFKGVLN
jgi:hypothetical protein